MNSGVKFCLGTLVVLTATQPSYAGDRGFINDPAIRGGVSVGQMALKDSGFDSHATGWDLFVGYEFNKYLAVEVGRLDGGAPSEDLGGGASIKVDNYAWHASALGSLPVAGDAASFFARLGMLNWHATAKGSVSGITVASASDSGNDVYYGGGVAINVDSGQLRLEYDRSKIDDLDASYVSLGIVWRF